MKISGNVGALTLSHRQKTPMSSALRTWPSQKIPMSGHGDMGRVCAHEHHSRQHESSQQSGSWHDHQTLRKGMGEKKYLKIGQERFLLQSLKRKTKPFATTTKVLAYCATQRNCLRPTSYKAYTQQHWGNSEWNASRFSEEVGVRSTSSSCCIGSLGIFKSYLYLLYRLSGGFQQHLERWIIASHETPWMKER